MEVHMKGPRYQEEEGEEEMRRRYLLCSGTNTQSEGAATISCALCPFRIWVNLRDAKFHVGWLEMRSSSGLISS